MKFISLFAGIGGLDLGLERAGMECVAQVEIDDFCQKILTKHWASIPKYKDVRDVGKHNLPTADLVCGGFPCQDVSLAGNRKGLEGKRSTLWSEFYRIVCEVQPRWVVIENVPGLLSSDFGEFFSKILRELSESGYAVTWRIIPASALGARHIRERIFIVANSEGSYARQSSFSKEHSWQSYYQGEWSRFWNELTRRGENTREQNYWIPESRLVRLVDGISSRMDKSRMKANGNAVVPQVAEYVGQCVMSTETRLTQRVPDVWDSARPQTLSTPEVNPLAKGKASPATRR